MRVRKVLAFGSVGVLIAAGMALIENPATAGSRRVVRPSGPPAEYVVLARDAASTSAAARVVVAAGAKITHENRSLGVLIVRAPSRGFAVAVSDNPAVAGVAHNRRIGADPGAAPVRDKVEQEGRTPSRKAPLATPHRRSHVPFGTDTFEPLQWDMQMIRADLARTVNAGSPRVRVGVIDTGIDASHPDLAPNFNRALSRNFTEDIPSIDGPCEVASCKDPADVDDGGHGTHVSGTIAAAANRYGIVGVAPRVQLVNLRAGQDSGYFFLGPTLDALSYAGDHGIDVVNMSFYVDPWLYNCGHNPADSPEAQLEQRTIVSAMNRALDYAHRNGVTLVAAMGNEHSDLGHPGIDPTSPDYPPDAAYDRGIDNRDCLSMPSEGNHVLNVSSIGPSRKKADYSNYGLEQIWLAAPGGWFRDGYGTPTYRTTANEVLSTYPLKVLQEEGSVDPNGNILPEAASFVFKECTPTGRCAYFTYLQGTSMASPHAVGVVALAVSRWGHHDPHHGGLTLAPRQAARRVADAATPTPCPTPRLQTYTREGRDESYNALCEGPRWFNGFYGHGIVDAYTTVAGRRR